MTGLHAKVVAANRQMISTNFNNPATPLRRIYQNVADDLFPILATTEVNVRLSSGTVWADRTRDGKPWRSIMCLTSVSGLLFVSGMQPCVSFYRTVSTSV